MPTLVFICWQTSGWLIPWDWWTSWLLKPVDGWQNVREGLKDSLPGTGGGRNPNDARSCVKILYMIPVLALLFCCYYRSFLQTHEYFGSLCRSSFYDQIKHVYCRIRSTGTVNYMTRFFFIHHQCQQSDQGSLLLGRILFHITVSWLLWWPLWLLLQLYLHKLCHGLVNRMKQTRSRRI